MMLEILSSLKFGRETRDALIDSLQNVCDEVMLPNKGFVCVVASDGNIVAYPGLSENDRMNLSSAILSGIDEENSFRFETLKPKQEFEGFFFDPNVGNHDIIISLPIEESDLRILVHQNRDAVRERAQSIARPLIFIGLAITVILSLSLFIIVDRLVLRYESRLEKLNDDLLNISNQRMQLIHILSHDLTNPLGAIKSACDLCDADSLLNDEARFYKDIVRKSADHGLGVVNIVRQIQALESGKMKLELASLNLKDSVDISYGMLHNRLADKDISIDMDIPPDLVVEAENYSLCNTVINNLLSNAIKFSERGSTIVITAAKEGDKVHLKIKDGGVGMPNGLVNKLFDLSKTTNRPGTEGETGTGFGMPLVRKIMEGYSGSIEVRSKAKSDGHEDHGTEVTLYFPKA